MVRVGTTHLTYDELPTKRHVYHDDRGILTVEIPGATDSVTREFLKRMRFRLNTQHNVWQRTIRETTLERAIIHKLVTQYECLYRFEEDASMNLNAVVEGITRSLSLRMIAVRMGTDHYLLCQAR